MKNLLIFFFFIFSMQIFAQEKMSAKVDKRVETLSIIFRLAGNEEYNHNYFESYVNDIHNHFDPHKSYPIIAFAKKMQYEKGISFDAVMSMATHVTQPPRMELIKEVITTLDPRWKKSDAKKFVLLLNDFYKTAQCEDFFKKHQTIYTTGENNFNAILADFDQNWYAKYYGGAPVEEYQLVLGFGNGGGGYGANTTSKNKKPEVYAIMGVSNIDKTTGQPTFKKEKELSTLIHEYNHSFINYLLKEDSNERKLKASGGVIFKKLEQEMNGQHYGHWQIMINESLVRASVVRYLIDHNADEKTVNKEILDQVNRGFLWTKELAYLLGEYESQRNKFADFKSFYPVIIDFFDATAKNIDKIKSDFESKQPKVASITPFENNAQDVDANIKEIVINFDRALNEKGRSIHLGKRGKEFSPLKGTLGYENDNKSYRIQVELKPNSEYEFVLTGLGFKSVEGYPLQEYEVKFKTK